MESKLDTIIAKIQKMFSFGKYREIIEQSPEVTLTKTKEGWQIRSIEFDFYDSIFVGMSGIYFHPEHGRSEQLLAFNGFDDFLNM